MNHYLSISYITQFISHLFFLCDYICINMQLQGSESVLSVSLYLRLSGGSRSYLSLHLRGPLFCLFQLIPEGEDLRDASCPCGGGDGLAVEGDVLLDGGIHQPAVGAGRFGGDAAVRRCPVLEFLLQSHVHGTGAAAAHTRHKDTHTQTHTDTHTHIDKPAMTTHRQRQAKIDKAKKYKRGMNIGESGCTAVLC